MVLNSHGNHSNCNNNIHTAHMRTHALWLMIGLFKIRYYSLHWYYLYLAFKKRFKIHIFVVASAMQV